MDTFGSQAVVATVHGFQEELRLFDEVVCRLGRVNRRRIFMCGKQVVGELGPCKRVEEDLRIKESLLELFDHLLSVIGDIIVLNLDERLGGPDHGLVGVVARLLGIAAVEQELGSKEHTIGTGHFELVLANHFAGALSFANITNTVLAWIGPI